MSLVERLAKQFALRRKREEELRICTASGVQTAAERQALIDKLSELEGSKAKLVEVKHRLSDEITNAEKESKANVETEAAKRKQLSDDLMKKISGLDTHVQSATLRHAAAAQENAKLKEQLGILESSTSTTDEKFSAVLSAHEKEHSVLQQRLENEEKMGEELTKQVASQEEALQAMKPHLDQLRKKVSQFLKQFNALQQQLSSTNDRFEHIQQEQARLVKRIATLESETESAATRKLRSQLEMDGVARELDKTEARLASTESQIEKIHAIVEMIGQQEKAAKQTFPPPERLE